MDENKNPESRYDVDEEEGATTVLRAMDAETEDEEEGATTVLRAEDMPPEDDDDTEGATTVLTGPEPAMMGAAPAPGACRAVRCRLHLGLSRTSRFHLWSCKFTSLKFVLSHHKDSCLSSLADQRISFRRADTARTLQQALYLAVPAAHSSSR